LFGQPLFERLGSGEVSTPGETLDGTKLLGQPPSDSGPAVILLLDHIDLQAKALRKALGEARQEITARADVKSETDPFAVIDEVTEQVERDLRTGEGIALPISFAIMIIVFGGFLAALLPIAGALAAIAGAMATLLGFSYLIMLDASTVNVVTVLGLGLCIDY